MDTVPQVVLGTNRPLSTEEDERGYSSTVESFFLHSSGSQMKFKKSSQLDDKVAISASVGATGKANKPYLLRQSTGYDMKETLIICQKLSLHANMDAPRQGGESYESMKAIDLLLDDPIACGYMEQFAKRTFCSENLSFVMAVQMFKDVWMYMNQVAESKLAVLDESRGEESSSEGNHAVFSSARDSDSCEKSFKKRRSDLSHHSTDTGSTGSTQLSADLKKLSIEEMGPLIVKRIVQDASKIWYMFLDEKGQNQISVDHKSFVSMMAAVWGPNPPKSVTVSQSQPELSKIFSKNSLEAGRKPTRRTSIARLLKSAHVNGTFPVAEEVGESGDMSGGGRDVWIPDASAFDEGLALAKKSLEKFVLPNFLLSQEFRVYKKRCGEAEELLRKGTASTLMLSSGASSFVGLGGNEWPILPTTSLLDDKELSQQLVQGKLPMSLDNILSDRYLFQKFFDFLQKRYCAETLLCYRSLQLFRLMFRDWAVDHGGKVNSPDEHTDSPIERLSWTVGVYFLSHGSDVEVPINLSKTYYRHLSYRMANPTVNMFSKVEQACYNILKADLLPEFLAKEENTPSALVEHMRGLVKLHKKESQNKDGKSNCCVQ